MTDERVEPTPADERAAMRAFLQRCEVRLSTMHRVATALLSGAGILVLLPAVERDSVVTVLRSLLRAPRTPATMLLTAAVVLSLVLAIGVLWLVVLELTRFYFHANHIRHGDGEVFTPRFTLTGLRMPSDELGTASDVVYDEAVHSPANVALIVPNNDRARSRIDRQIDAYPGLRAAPETHRPHAEDVVRAEALFELAASRRRTLAEEVVKVEYGMARHMLRLQVVVLRYVKALLVVVATTIATYVTATAVNDPNGLSASDQRWVAATMAIWAPIVIIVVTAPIRWLGELLRSEGAQRLGLQRDREFTQLEDFAGRIASLTWLAAVAAMIDLFTREGSHASTVALSISLAISVALAVVAAVRWRGASWH